MRLLPLVLLLWPTLAWSTEPPLARDDEQVLRAAGVGTDGKSLLAYFRERSARPPDAKQIAQLIAELGDDRFRVREQASARLVSLGCCTVSALEKAVRSSDIEVVRRAEACLRAIARGRSEEVARAALRALAVRKPDGALRAVLDYVGGVKEPDLINEVPTTLAILGVREGKADPVLVAALKDRSPARRAAAAVALQRAGDREAQNAVRKLLDDPEPTVRLTVAMVRAASRDTDTVPVLIKVLDQLPAEQTASAETLLARLAGADAPSVPTGTSGANRRELREAWQKWYDKEKGKITGERVARATRPLGHTLVVLLDAGRIIDLNEKNQPRWQIDKLEMPLDAQWLPGDRVLVTEYRANQVRERDRHGKVLWEFKADEPIAAQRLANGHTFVATRTHVLEVDARGREVSRLSPPGGARVMKAQKLRNGDVALVIQLSGSSFVRMNPSGDVVCRFDVQVSTSGGRIEVLDNGHVLVPEKENNRVVEVDDKGKVVWQVEVEQPIAAVRLPNGNTLVTSFQQHRAVELDRRGKVVWEYKSDTRITRAWRR